MFKTRELNNSIKNFSFLNDINDNIDKCITESNLEEHINSFNENELNEAIYTSLNNMLKSTDDNTVELGIKMLNNFNVKKYALQIGSLLRLNGQNIERNKALNTVGFKNIMSQLGTNFNNIK